MRLALIIASIVLATVLGAVPGNADKRLAPVIGNSNDPNAGRLTNPGAAVDAAVLKTAGFAAVTAETSPEPATASPAGAKLAGMPEIEFYLARGEADACGRGCNEWIAAEGKIDLGGAFAGCWRNWETAGHQSSSIRREVRYPARSNSAD
jgi:hypothetical protein